MLDTTPVTRSLFLPSETMWRSLRNSVSNEVREVAWLASMSAPFRYSVWWWALAWRSHLRAACADRVRGTEGGVVVPLLINLVISRSAFMSPSVRLPSCVAGIAERPPLLPMTGVAGSNEDAPETAGCRSAGRLGVSTQRSRPHTLGRFGSWRMRRD
jgi:hypothetical protein